jgi:hypothetical protein
MFIGLNPYGLVLVLKLSTRLGTKNLFIILLFTQSNLQYVFQSLCNVLYQYVHMSVQLYHYQACEHNHYHCYVNPLNAELNPICHLLALLAGATIVVISRLRVKSEHYLPLQWHLHSWWRCGCIVMLGFMFVSW